MDYFSKYSLKNIRLVSGGRVVDMSSDYLVVTSTGTITLPDVSTLPKGFLVTVVAVGVGSVNVVGNMRSNASYYGSLAVSPGISFINDGVNWNLIP